MKYRVTITVTLPKRPKSDKISATISAKDVASAISLMISGIFSDPSRKGSTIWYRDFNSKMTSFGYRLRDKRMLISALRSDAIDFPKLMSFPPGFSQKKIEVVLLPDDPPEEKIKKPKKPEQLSLFGSVRAFGFKYVEVSAKNDEGLGVPYGKEDKNKLRELARKTPKVETEYAIFFRIYSPQALTMLESGRTLNPTPEESDLWSQFLKKLRSEDVWILSDRKATSSIPPDATLGEIVVADIRGLSSTNRNLTAYVAGNTAYVAVVDAFVGAPPTGPDQGQGPPM